MNPLLHIVSLGCSKNQVDTEVMLAKLGDYEMTNEPASADLIIVNTCGFIEAAKSESLGVVMQLHEARKEGSTLVMAGCLSERYKEELQKQLPEVDIFTGVGDYARIDELVRSRKSEFTEEVFLQTTQERKIINSSYHAYIKLAEGCNQSCSFCAIPTFKGKLHSRENQTILQEIQKLIARGYYDFSLVSQDSSSFGRDRNEKDALLELVRQIDELEDDFFVRILYLYPSTTDENLITAIAQSKKVLPYFDMPIQHISDLMLKKMKRGSGTQVVKQLLNAMRSVPDSFVRTTVIVGHPGESGEDFEELLFFLKEFDFDAVSVFEYSDEEGTAAHEMPDKVDKNTIKNRLKKIQKLLDKKNIAKLASAVGSTIYITVEGESDEHEFLLSAKANIWAPQIDGEILINDSEVEGIKYGARYQAIITQAAPKTLMATVTQAC